MWWIIGIIVFSFFGLLALSLCKSAGDYDRLVEEAFARDLAANRKDAET